MPESVLVQCGHCGSRLKLKNRDKLGTERACPRCGKSFVLEENVAREWRPRAKTARRPATTKSRRQPVAALLVVAATVVAGVGIVVYAISNNGDEGTPGEQQVAQNDQTSAHNGNRNGGSMVEGDRIAEALSRGVEQGDNRKPADWVQWRGPRRDGVSTETGLLQSWPDEGPPLAWRVRGLGSGMSSLVISGEYLYTLGDKGGCKIQCRKLSDGSEVWATQIGGYDPNCTPTVDPEAGLVSGMTKQGELGCVDAKTGDLVWKKHLQRDFGGKMMSDWGYSESPLVDGDRLICTPGGRDAVIVALDKKTGETIWKASQPANAGRSGNDGAGYSSIVVSHGGGVKQYVQLTGRGLISVAAENGRMLWTYNRIANNVANVPTPIVKGDYVFCSSGYGTGAGLIRLNKRGDGVDAEEVYFLGGDRLQNHHGGMVLVDDYVYMGHGHNNGFPVCVEFAKGKIVWGGRIRGAGSGSAAIVCADGHLYFRYEDATMALIEATPDGYKLKGSFRIASNNGKSWSHPVIYNGRLYLRDQDELLCYDMKR